jgi:hypothetical protein
MRLITSMLKSTPIQWLSVLSNIAPPRLRHEASLFRELKSCRSHGRSLPCPSDTSSIKICNMNNWPWSAARWLPYRGSLVRIMVVKCPGEWWPYKWPFSCSSWTWIWLETSRLDHSEPISHLFIINTQISVWLVSFITLATRDCVVSQCCVKIHSHRNCVHLVTQDVRKILRIWDLQNRWHANWNEPDVINLSNSLPNFYCLRFETGK